MSAAAKPLPPRTAEGWSRVDRPLKRPYDGPPVLFRADPRKDPRITAACADIELDLRNYSVRGPHGYIVWPSLAQLCADSKRSDSTVRGHTQTLKRCGRIVSLKGIANLKEWFLVHGPKFGLSFEKLKADMGHRLPNDGQFYILVSRLPPIQDGYEWDSIYPLKFREPDEEEPEDRRDSGGSDRRDSGGSDRRDSGGSDRRDSGGSTVPLPIRSEEMSSEVVEERAPEMAHDDEMVASEDREAKRAELVALVQANPNQAWARRLLERFDSATPPEPESRRRSTWVESTAAGRERDPEPATKAPGGRQGDRGRSEAESIARKVAGRTMTPQAGGKALADAVNDAMPLTPVTYRDGLAALLDGRVSLEEMLGVIAEVFKPGVDHPNKQLSIFFAEVRRRVKKPAAGQSRQRFPAAGLTQSDSASPHCTVVK